MENTLRGNIQKGMKPVIHSGHIYRFTNVYIVRQSMDQAHKKNNKELKVEVYILLNHKIHLEY